MLAPTLGTVVASFYRSEICQANNVALVLLTRWLPDVSQDAVTRSRGYGDHGDFSLETAVLERMRY